MTRLVAACVLSLLACTSGSGSQSTVMSELGADGSMIDAVHFSTTTGIAANPAPDVDVTVTGNAARAIYGTTITLPEWPPGTYSCPIDWGVTYTLQFSASGQDVVEATLDPSGCEGATVSVDGGSVDLWIAEDSTYWSTLAYELGITEASIFPYNPPGLD